MKIVYPAEGTVSIWIGTFPSEVAFENAIDRFLVPKLRLNVPIESICEVSFESTPVSVSALLEGFSGFITYQEQAIDVANLKEIKNANSAIVCFHLMCEGFPDVLEGLTFLGSFVGQDIDQ